MVCLAAEATVTHAAPSKRSAAKPTLQDLAAGAKNKGGWGLLRAYAHGENSPEQKGLALLVLGYREYEADEDAAAVKDLRRAAETNFPLADFADYFQAVAAREARRPKVAVELLESFPSRHPESLLRYDALDVLAQLFVEIGKPERAIQMLTAEPKLHVHPALLMDLAYAYRETKKLEEAAKTFQEVYYGFPSSSEAVSAGDALEKSKGLIGDAAFPRVAPEIRARRAEQLQSQSQYPQALAEFDGLLHDLPSALSRPRWTIGRARCLLYLGRTSEALSALEPPIAGNPTLDAERLSLIVEAYARSDDADAIVMVLNQLRQLYPQTLSYASALNTTANTYFRRLDWTAATTYYQTLFNSFPMTELGMEAHWHVAWLSFLQGQKTLARQAFEEHVVRYPASGHVAAALYWLGRLAQDEGRRAEARGLYELVQERFVQSYYAYQARERLRTLPPDPPGNGPGTPSRWPHQIVELAKRVPVADPPPVHPCAPTPASEALRRTNLLHSVGLDGLAEDYLKALMAERPAGPELILALSRIEADEGLYNASVLDLGKLVPKYSQYEFSALPREVWDLLFPRAYWDLVKREASARGLDAYLLMGLIRQESAFEPRAVSRANARGLMQVLPETASPSRRQRLAVARRLYEPTFNVRVGSRYLQELEKSYGGVAEQALAAYHAGGTRVNAWLREHSFLEPAEFLETIPIPATRGYVERVLRDARIYRQLMTGSAVFNSCELLAASTAGRN